MPATRGRNHRQDTRPDYRGEHRPRGHHAGEVGVRWRGQRALRGRCATSSAP